jgi:hypothetical protein
VIFEGAGIEHRRGAQHLSPRTAGLPAPRYDRRSRSCC